MEIVGDGPAIGKKEKRQSRLPGKSQEVSDAAGFVKLGADDCLHALVGEVLQLGR
ncbi:hypothetical protein DSECCO2_541370 [anaerobic digester metagenome]